MPDRTPHVQESGTVCRKVRYPTADAAWVAVDEARAKRHRGKTEASVYRCRRCRGWHLTAQLPRWATRAQ